jgi:REP element-mobilizing transposase RayT
MPRANRYYLPSLVWHITHRCHRNAFLLEFAHDRRRYLHWVFEAKKRFGLSVLDYMITSNHIHLLIKDNGADVIAQSMQLIAGRTTQEYNQCKAHHGAFWEDRYHATAIGTDEHLHRCIVYIDLNMVRAGVVEHPGQWLASGYREIQNPPERYAVIDLQQLIESCGFTEAKEFQRAHYQWIEEALAGKLTRAAQWSEAIAVGGSAFVEQVQKELGVEAMYCSFERGEQTSVLREPSAPYDGYFAGENDALRSENTVLWDKNAAIP